MILYLKNKIYKSDTLTSDSLFELMKINLFNDYNFSKISDTKFRLKRISKMDSYGRYEGLKYLFLNSRGLIEIRKNELIYKLNLSNQMIFTFLLDLIVVIVLYEFYDFKIITGFLIVLIPSLIIWIIVLIKGYIYTKKISRIIKNLI